MGVESATGKYKPIAKGKDEIPKNSTARPIKIPEPTKIQGRASVITPLVTKEIIVAWGASKLPPGPKP